MNQATVEHPDAAQLAAFVSGRLNDLASLEIEHHLVDCQVCATVLEKLPQDSFGGFLQPSCTIADMKNATPWENVAARTLDAGAEIATIICQTPLELADHPRYRVLEPLGAGGMGTVFKAEHRHMERLVALKVINPKLIDSPTAVERFRREVKLAARLAHPNIVTAYDADQAGSLHFLVMEFVEGKSLAQVVAEQGPLPAAPACDYSRQATLGLQHACDRHMAHRDIKPHNLMLTPDGQVKILDFGLARFVFESAPTATDSSVAAETTATGQSTEPGVTGIGQIMGSVDYIAPEQVRDAHQADIRSDIYSLGCTLYYLLAGHLPFAAASVAEKLAAHADQTAKPLTQIRTDLPAGLAPVIERMMAKDPAQRYQTPAEVAAALAPFASARPQPWSGRRLRWAVGASLLLIALGVVGYLSAPAIYRFATNQGELVIEVDDKDVEVVIKENGNLIRIIDTKTRKALTLKAGKYEIDLTPEQKKKGLTLETDRITLTRGGRQIVKAYFNPEGLKAEAKAELNRKIARLEKKVQRQRAHLDLSMTQFKRMEQLGRQHVVVPADVEEARHKLAIEEATLAEMATELSQLRERARRLDKEFPLKEETEVDYKIALLEKSVLRQRAQTDYLRIAFKRQMQRDVAQAEFEEARQKLAIEEAALAEMVTELQQLRERAKGSLEPGHAAPANLQPESALLDFHVADFYARTGLSHKAAAAFQRGLEKDPQDYGDFGHYGVLWRLALLRLQLGEKDGWQRTCREMLQRFGNTADPEIAHRTARACLLASNSVASIETIMKLADRSVAGTENHPNYRDFQMVKYLAEYRDGRHDSAIKGLRDLSPSTGGSSVDAICLASLALAQHRLGRTAQARAALDDCQAMMNERAPNPAKGRPYPPDWYNWLHSWITYREAERMIKTSGVEKLKPGKKLD